MPEKTSTLPVKPFPVRLLITAILLVAVLIYSAYVSGVDLPHFFQNAGNMTIILQKMSHPDWSYADTIWKPLFETIRMAIIGTTFGALVALPFSILAARNIIQNKFVNGILRFILNIIRTIPDLMLASIFVAIVGIGPVAGIISLSIFSFGMISKLFYEAIETIDEGPVEALISSGANKWHIIRFAVIPQVSSHFLSYVLYAFEINVRASTVLGYIGAGGIGIFLQRSLSQLRYDRASVIILATFAVVLIIDTVSNQIRKRLL